MKKAADKEKLPWITWRMVGTGIIAGIVFFVIMYLYDVRGF